MSSEDISLNGLNSQLVFPDETLRFNCQHRVGDPGPKTTRELSGFIDEKMFSVDRERYFRSQSTHLYPDRAPSDTRDWNNNGNATSPSTDESDPEDDDVDDDDDDDDPDHLHKSNNNNANATNINMAPPPTDNDKMANGKAAPTKHSAFAKNGNALQTVNNSALVTVAEAEGDVYYAQYLQGTEGPSASGQHKECVVVDNGSGESLRAILSDPVMGALMDDAMILPCGHSFGAAGIQHILRTKACFTCSRPVSEDTIAPNLSLRAAVQAFRREEELQFHRSCKRKRERFDQDKGGFGDSALTDPPRGRGVQFPFAVTDRVIIKVFPAKGNKRTPQRFVGREAVVTTQCLNGWYVVKTLDNAESVKLQYRSLAKVSDDQSSKPMSSKLPPNWL